MSLDTASALTPPRQVLDEARLLAFLHSVPALAGAPHGPLRVQQFKHGQSNPTYLLELGARRLVLRKQPPGKLLASAHAVDREYRVLKALADYSKVPVPQPLVLCTDSSVIGTPFYVMEFAAGRIFVDPNMPDASPSQRTAAYTQLAHTLAALHSVSPGAVGLDGFGNPTNYCRRQLSRWAVQYVASVPQPSPQVLRLIGWLQSHIPAADATASAVVHGDFRLDNLVFDEATMKAKAVLDWELSTLGNPWADAAYMCMAYHLPSQLQHMQLASPLPAGLPTEEQLLGSYCAAAGVQPPSREDWAFYMALSVFRLLAILAGVQARARQGNASSAHAAAISSDTVLAALADAALAIVARAGGKADSISAESVAAQIGAAGALQRSSRGGSGGTGSRSNGSAGGAAGSGDWGSSASGVASRSGGTGSSDRGSSGGGGIRGPLERPPVLGEPSPKAQELLAQLRQFMEASVYPAEEALERHAGSEQRWSIHPLVEQLKEQARAQGLWNLWVPADMAAELQHLLPLVPESERSTLLGAGLSNLDYAHLCEVMGSSIWAPELFNCSAPDTGNMEVLARYGSRTQQAHWLLPLLRGRIRSCFAMTEKAVASSDATNITASIARAPAGGYVLDGVKWWTSGAMDPRCKVCIFMGKTDPSAPRHMQQSMALVPFDAPGITVIRPLTVMGYDDAPHGHAEVHFEGVQVGPDAIILGEGRGFEIAQGRLGPGRLHHCMRLVGMGERALRLMARRALQRKVFGGPLAAQGGFMQTLGKCRVELDGARLMVLAAAHALDRVGNKRARGEIAAAKVAAPNAVLRIVDAAMQAHGAAGLSQDTVLAHFWATARTLRLADGPDEVHLESIAKLELSRARAKL